MDIAIVALIIGAVALYLYAKGKGQTRQSQPTSLAHLPEKFIVFDLETTGLTANKHEVLEIGAIRVNRDSINHETYQSLIKPTRKVPAKITELTGITQKMVDLEGVALDLALREFREFVGDLRLVSFNAEFDMAFLHAATTTAGVPAFRNPVSCALKMSRRAWPGRKSYRLAELAKDGGLSSEGTHRALGDCQRALIVYTAASARLKSVS
jgi:DNA polymerase III epsilon subunit family exonuclease